jgi:hypothetical protein
LPLAVAAAERPVVDDGVDSGKPAADQEAA